jgi:chromosome segregation ATPase
MSEDVKTVEQSEQNSESVTQEEEVKPESSKDGQNVDGLVKKNQELLSETKKAKKERDELKAKMQELEDKKLQEKEEYKTLYEKEKEKAKELPGLKDKADRYDAYFKEQFDKSIEKEPESVKRIFDDLNLPYDEKLQRYNAYRADLGKGTNSPAAERVGGDIPEVDVSEYVNENGSTNMEKLLNLSYSNPEMYKLVQNKIDERR